MRTILLSLVSGLAIACPFAEAGGIHGDREQTFELVQVDNSSVLPGDDPFVPDFNDGSYFTFDLMVTTVNVDFDAASVDATLSGPSEFFEHPAGQAVPPDPGLFQIVPALEFDTFLDGGPGSIVTIVSLHEEPQLIDVAWLADGPYLPDDTYRIARFSFRFTEPGVSVFTVEGNSSDPQGGGASFPIGPLDVTVEYIPEPGAFTLLALGGALTLRRRCGRGPESPVLVRSMSVLPRSQV